MSPPTLASIGVDPSKKGQHQQGHRCFLQPLWKADYDPKDIYSYSLLLEKLRNLTPPFHITFFFFFFFGAYVTPRLGVKLELQLPAYITATATLDPSCVCNLYHSLGQHWILNPVSGPRDRTRILMDTSWVHFH